jgi:hypothetical protein
MRGGYIASVILDIAQVDRRGTREKKRDYGPTISSTKKKMISRTRRNMILAERDRAMVCEIGKEEADE